MSTVGDIAHKVRSKNAGPFWLTVDVFCGTRDAFARISQGLDSADVAAALQVDPAVLKRFDLANLNVPGPYTVKLEGARRSGFQTVSIALIRDPRYVANIRSWCDDIVVKCTAKAKARVEGDFGIELRIIGLDSTLGPLDTAAKSGTEVGVMGIVTAGTQALSMEVAKMLNPYLLHHPLSEDEEMPTFAFPFSPPEMPRGAIHEFCLNHILSLDDPMEAFHLDVIEVGV